ncbi:MAG: metalloregulator ArsR/SmtB family transcription factor [Paracoccaceae bacterium]|nr:metalloregulator ArsR/SmtB family transcription factor [Paracoccaceae bacterium]
MTYATPNATSAPGPDPVIAALADPTRRAIVERLGTAPASVSAIAAGFPVSRPAISQHLRVLGDAGLVTVRAEGTRRIYALAPDGAAPLRDWLDRLWDDALHAFAEKAREEAST